MKRQRYYDDGNSDSRQIKILRAFEVMLQEKDNSEFDLLEWCLETVGAATGKFSIPKTYEEAISDPE